MQKHLITCFLFILISINIVAVNYFNMQKHIILLEINEEGNAKITEKFYLKFVNVHLLEKFREKSKELGTDLSKWYELDPRIKFYIGNKQDIKPLSASIGFFENDVKYLQLSYELVSPIMIKKNETPRGIEFELKTVYLSSFLDKPFYRIPADTELRFILPKKITITKEGVSPEAEIIVDPTATILIWKGAKDTTLLRLKYTFWKELSPSISISLLFKDFLEKTPEQTKLLIFTIFLIVIVLIYWKRDTINKKIINYIIKNTRFSGSE